MTADADDRTRRFEAHRDRLFGVAYRMTGSVADAEDCVQDAFLRWRRLDLDPIVHDEAYLVRVVTRLAIDRQRATARRRESYVGPWLPEPLVAPLGGATIAGVGDPAHAAELADSLSFAFLVMLDRLSPSERAAFILHDVFGVAFDEVATTLDREVEACRQLASRARRKLRDGDAATAHAPPPEDPAAAATLGALMAALATGDIDECLRHLAPGVVLVSDSGPHRRAARHEIGGAARVGRLMLKLFTQQSPLIREVRPVEVNGSLGLLMDHPDGPMVFAADLDGEGRIRHLWIQMNPDKLTRVLADSEG